MIPQREQEQIVTFLENVREVLAYLEFWLYLVANLSLAERGNIAKFRGLTG